MTTELTGCSHSNIDMINFDDIPKVSVTRLQNLCAIFEKKKMMTMMMMMILMIMVMMMMIVMMMMMINDDDG